MKVCVLIIVFRLFLDVIYELNIGLHTINCQNFGDKTNIHRNTSPAEDASVEEKISSE
jgi:hypothetical protein